MMLRYLRCLRFFVVGSVLFVTSVDSAGQGADPLRQYIKVDAPVVALTHARVIDGTGAAAKEDQTLVIRDGNIAEIGDAAKVKAPEGATAIDLTGKSVIPGLVMVHEHLYYPTGPGVYGQLGESFVASLSRRRRDDDADGRQHERLHGPQPEASDRGRAASRAGDRRDGAVPERPEHVQLQMHALKDADDARQQVAYWAEMGATSFKAYMQITRDELRAAIEEAHKRGLKITGHLCSVTYAEAADLGIDNLEHGFLASTDFVADKQPDVCPGQRAGQQHDRGARRERRAVQGAGEEADRQESRADVHAHRVRDVHAGPADAAGTRRAAAAAQGAVRAELRSARHATRSRCTRRCFRKRCALERAFARAGGMLIAGTDPTGGGGVVPGYSNQRQLELLVEAGFTPLEAIRIGTLNGATYLGRDARVGSIAAGKQADLVVIDGDPSTTIADVRKVETVFKHGVGFDPAKLIASVSGKVGLW